MAKITKKMKAALEFLGAPYEVKPIDWEMCVYLDMKNGYDLEVSGINHPERGKICNFVAVWDVTNGKNYGARTVEYVRNIKSLRQLKSVLDELCERYGSHIWQSAGNLEYKRIEHVTWIPRALEKKDKIQTALIEAVRATLKGGWIL